MGLAEDFGFQPAGRARRTGLYAGWRYAPWGRRDRDWELGGCRAHEGMAGSLGHPGHRGRGLQPEHCGWGWRKVIY